jgi:hypothetical protein
MMQSGYDLRKGQDGVMIALLLLIAAITVRSSRQLNRFPHLINADNVFGTHTGYNFRKGQ